MELFNPNAKIDFMRMGRVTIVVSLVLLVIALVSLATRGLNLALDFTGGTLIEVNFEQATDTGSVRKALQAGGFEQSVVQSLGNPRDYAIRLAPEVGALQPDGEDGVQQTLEERIQAALLPSGEVTVKPAEYVGPQVGRELVNQGMIAVLVVALGIMAFVWLRFETWKFGLAAVACDLHDVLIVVGCFSLFQWEFDLTVLAAILAIVGYSINDTIVVFDRIRETFRSAHKMSTDEVLNKAINTTLSRTTVTALTTFLTVVALFFLGGPAVHNFARALIIGIALGTLSSIFFASPLLRLARTTKHDLLPRARDELALDRRP
ncbi:MAG: protein translocase subunit SecF [Lysobacterales bacterium]